MAGVPPVDGASTLGADWLDLFTNVSKERAGLANVDGGLQRLLGGINQAL